MEFIATQKFIMMSPRKLRYTADMVKKLEVIDAIETLPLVGKRAGISLAKVIKTAVANAKQKGISDTDLIFKEIQIGEGPRLKRGMPISRGRWHPIKRRMSHIRVVLKTKEEEKSVTGNIRSEKSAKGISIEKAIKKSPVRERSKNPLRTLRGKKTKQGRSESKRKIKNKGDK